MFKFVSTLATVLAVSVAAPVFAQDSSSTSSDHAAMQHNDSMHHESSMTHGGKGHDSMAHTAKSSMTHGSMHHDATTRGDSSAGGMKHEHGTTHDSMTHDPKASGP